MDLLMKSPISLSATFANLTFPSKLCPSFHLQGICNCSSLHLGRLLTLQSQWWLSGVSGIWLKATIRSSDATADHFLKMMIFSCILQCMLPEIPGKSQGNFHYNFWWLLIKSGSRTLPISSWEYWEATRNWNHKNIYVYFLESAVPLITSL